MSCPACLSKNVRFFGKKEIYTLISCVDCDHLFVSNPPPQIELDNYYSQGTEVINLAQRRNFNQGTQQTLDNHWVINYISNIYSKKSLTILEVGPGDGSLLNKLKNMGHTTFGVDPGNYLDQNNFFLNLSELDNTLTKNGGGLIDVVIMIDVIEHIRDPFVYFDNFSHFASDTILFLSTPSTESLQFRRLKMNWKMIAPPAHLHFFSSKSLDIFLEKNSFLFEKAIDMNSKREMRYFVQFLRLFATYPIQFYKFGKVQNPYKKRIVLLFEFVLDFIFTDNHWILARYNFNRT